MAIQALSPDDVYKYLHTSPSGLEGHEASERLKHFGPNEIIETARKSLLYTLIKHLTNLFAILLWCTTIVSFIGEAMKPGEGFIILGFAIMGVIFINGGFAFFQEYRAEKAFEELKKLLPFRVAVIRDGKEIEVTASEIVPGDVVLLKEGDRVPADIRLIESAELKVDASSLTGESMPVKRTSSPQNNADLIDSINLVFAGTSVVTGQGRGVAFATGMSTEFGKIARLTSEVKSGMSPLELETIRVTRTISIIAVFLGVLFFLIGIIAGRSFWENFIFALGIVVANIPEGLVPTVTLSLAMASQRMAKKKAIVRKLTSVETLGAVTVICTDKTGTLTQNKMSVVEVYTSGQHWLRKGEHERDKNVPPIVNINVDRRGFLTPPEGVPHDLFLKAITLCNDAHTRDSVIIGDPTEKALLEFAQNYLDIDTLKSEEPRISEQPFDSVRKWMATIHEKIPPPPPLPRGGNGGVEIGLFM
ncbi:MAG: cation-transporting P-type ATPase [Nitrospirae bacterium]|nr:cation-transporting P-type ATPase [Nitrospirota bacterium]